MLPDSSDPRESPTYTNKPARPDVQPDAEPVKHASAVETIVTAGPLFAPPPRLPASGAVPRPFGKYELLEQLGRCEEEGGHATEAAARYEETIAADRPAPAAAYSYVFEVDDPNAVTQQGGFVKVRYAGTGFLMIRREAVERMCAHYPQLKFKRDHSLDAATLSDNRYALFDTMIDSGGTYLSEDFAFCKRWTDMGGEIWADLASKLQHVGPQTFAGDLSSQFVGA